MKKVRSRKDFTSKWQEKYEETIPLLSEHKPLQRTNFKIIIKKLTKALKSKKEGFLNFRRLLLIQQTIHHHNQTQAQICLTYVTISLLLLPPPTLHVQPMKKTGCFMNLHAEFHVKGLWKKVTFTRITRTEQDFLLGQLFTGSNNKAGWTQNE